MAAKTKIGPDGKTIACKLRKKAETSKEVETGKGKGKDKGVVPEKRIPAKPDGTAGVVKGEGVIPQKQTLAKPDGTPQKAPVRTNEKRIEISKEKPTEGVEVEGKEVKPESLKDQKIYNKDRKETIKSGEEGVRQVVGQNVQIPEGALKVDKSFSYLLRMRLQL